MQAHTLLQVLAGRLPAHWPVCANLQHAAETIWLAASPRWPDLSIEVMGEVDSTNSELMRRARAGQHERTLLVTPRQTAGRGRLGREWHTQHKPALTMSLGLPMAPRDWSGLSLVVGLVLAQQLGHGAGIKWPNDLWQHGRKLCGILVETAGLNAPGQATAPHDPSSPAMPVMPARYVVIGMGVNLSPPEGDGLRTPPVGLLDLLPTGPKATASDSAAQADLGASAMALLLPPLLDALATFEQHGFAPFAEAYAALDVLRGERVNLSDGRSGLCLGVDERGAMRVHIDGEAQAQAVDSGEISLRPAV